MIVEVIMSATVNVHEAKTHLSKLLQRVQNGEQIVIARGGVPIALLSPVTTPSTPRVPGNDAGRVTIGPDFDAPLPEFD